MVGLAHMHRGYGYLERTDLMKKNIWAAALMPLILVSCGGEAPKQEATASKEATGTTASATTGGAAATATKELNIYNWSDYVDPDTVKEFEAANNVTVRYDVYDSNETLEAKVLTGKSGYDLVVPSISHVGRQIKAGAYQEMDKSQLSNYNNIDPALLKMLDQVDPGNKYAVPYFWGMNTIGINKDKVSAALGGKLPDNLWDLVFNPEYTSKLKSCGISMLDSPSEVFPLALHYLKKDPHSANPDDLKAAAEVIKKVRTDVKRFSSSGYIDDLARGDLCVVLGYGGDLNIAARRAVETKNGVNIEALVPKEGVAIWIDSFMIPKDATNIANAYKYINASLDPKVAAKNGNFVTYAPASKPAKDLIEKKYTENRSIFPTDADLQNSFVALPMTPDAVKLSVRMWQGIKAGQ